MEKANNNRQPLISFIITDYNLPVEMLRECLDSILGVSLADDEREVILVDDGSSVSPWSELTDFHDSVVYLRQMNKGLSEARNAGIERAVGTFVQFVDGDDCLIKSGYDDVLRQLRNDRRADIVMFGHTRRKDTRPSKHRFRTLSGKTFIEKRNVRAAACSYVFRREIIGDLRFIPDIYHEDEAFTPRLLLRCRRASFAATEAYFYRPRAESITLNTNEEHRAKRFDDLLGIIAGLQKEEKTHSALRRRTRQLTMDYLYQAIRLSSDYAQFESRRLKLLQHDLLPLPLCLYTARYFLFALLSRHDAGRRALYKLLH